MTCAVPIAPWRAGWGRRHHLAAIAAFPVASWAYAQAAAPVTGVAWVVLLATLAFGAALVVASYLPRADGMRAPAASPCAAGPLVQLLLAGMFLGLGGVGGGLAAALVVFVAVLQRTAGSSTCSIGPR